MPWWSCLLVFISTLNSETDFSFRLHFLQPQTKSKNLIHFWWLQIEKPLHCIKNSFFNLRKLHNAETLNFVVFWTSFFSRQKALKRCDAVFITQNLKASKLDQSDIWIYVKSGNAISDLLKLCLRSFESISFVKQLKTWHQKPKGNKQPEANTAAHLRPAVNRQPWLHRGPNEAVY